MTVSHIDIFKPQLKTHKASPVMAHQPHLYGVVVAAFWCCFFSRVEPPLPQAPKPRNCRTTKPPKESTSKNHRKASRPRTQKQPRGPLIVTSPGHQFHRPQCCRDKPCSARCGPQLPSAPSSPRPGLSLPLRRLPRTSSLLLLCSVSTVPTLLLWYGQLLSCYDFLRDRSPSIVSNWAWHHIPSPLLTSRNCTSAFACTQSTPRDQPIHHPLCITEN